MSVPSASSSVEHWAYQVQSPLREPAQIRELASGQGRSLPAGDAWGEMLQEFEAEQPTDEDEFDPESEFEAYDGFEPSTEADAYEGEAFGEGDDFRRLVLQMRLAQNEALLGWLSTTRARVGS